MRHCRGPNEKNRSASTATIQYSLDCFVVTSAIEAFSGLKDAFHCVDVLSALMVRGSENAKGQDATLGFGCNWHNAFTADNRLFFGFPPSPSDPPIILDSIEDSRSLLRGSFFTVFGFQAAIMMRHGLGPLRFLELKPIPCSSRTT
jgi:hypothetical protein